MSTYKFIKYTNPDNKFDTTKVIHVVSTESLPELLEAFEYFLKGCGYIFDGSLTIEPDNESWPKD